MEKKIGNDAADVGSNLHFIPTEIFGMLLLYFDFEISRYLFIIPFVGLRETELTTVCNFHWRNRYMCIFVVFTTA